MSQEPVPAPDPALVVGALRAAGVPATEEPEALAAAGRDWTGRFSGPVLGLARPRDPAEVAAVLAVAAALGVPVQVQGGNTGLVGGSVPAPGSPAIVCSTLGLAGVGSVDRAGTVVVGAGVTCAELARAARAAGWRFGVDLAARDSATVGGMVATNAGGINVCAFGMMRSQVVGVQAVVPADPPAILDTIARPAKDNAGYDLGQLLIGSEGTLAIVTAVQVQLHRPPGPTSLAVLPAASLDAAVSVARLVSAGPGRLLAAEVMDATSITLAARHGHPLPVPPGTPWAVLLEVADGGDGSGLAAIAELDPAIALDVAAAARIWRVREELPLAYSAAAGPAGVVHKLDVSVLPERLGELTSRLAAVVPGLAEVRGWGCFGHLLDGNLHVQVWGPLAGDDRCAAAVLGEVARLGGAVSAEHGIGRAKAAYLGLSRTPAQVAAMAAIRAALDPRGLLNPGVLVPSGLAEQSLPS